ncbi:MAG: hypothetical protein M1166_08195 [Candidatus Thermoplasmatota archaeon]|nr:hypothetical protein [Candidatus Thermoplasmatota archaeon]
MNRKWKVLGAIIIATVMVVVVLSETLFFDYTANYGEKKKSSVLLPIDQISEIVHSKFSNIAVNVFSNENFLAQSYFQITSNLTKEINSTMPSALVMYEDSSTRASLYNDLLCSYKEDNQVMTLQLSHPVNSAEKSNTVPDSIIYTVKDLVITFHTFGIYLINTTGNGLSGISWALSEFETKLINLSRTPSNSDQQMTLTENGFTFIGSVGLYTSCGYGKDNYNGVIFGGSGKAIMMKVDTNFYEANQTTGQGKYYFFMAINNESLYGYSYSGWSFIPSFPYYAPWFVHYGPGNFQIKDDWHTSKWPGQELFSWGPMNSGSNTHITFGLSSATPITYSAPGGLAISWADESDPAKGIFDSLQEVSGMAGTEYSVEPSSIGMLNPTKSGGILPMFLTESFYGSVRAMTLPYSWWVSSSASASNISIALYTNFLDTPNTP